MQHSIALIAGQLARVEIPGSYFLLMDMGASTSLTVTLRNGFPLESVTVTKKGLKLRGAPFNLVELTSANDATVQIAISDGLVDIDLIEDATVNAVLSGANDGSVAKPLNVSAVTVADTPASAINTLAPVVCGPVAAQIKAANANCRQFAVHNEGPDPVAIGGAGITWATRGANVLQSGDMVVFDRGGNLAWYGITDAGLTATVGVTEVQQ